MAAATVESPVMTKKQRLSVGKVEKVNKKGRESTGGKTPKKQVQAKLSEESAQSPASVSGACLEGMSAAELTMVRRLAGNDPVVRKKTMRKLKKWLNVLAQKVPDTPDCRPLIEPNFIRVWKALFYCMWMADKPLPQEQLAENISELQRIFASKPASFLLFVEWFLRTMAREWSWIDRFRMDKFMMLFRRFIRKSLFVVAEKKWHNDVLEGFLKLISVHIFNRHPSPKSKKLEPKVHLVQCPLGLQIHFTDIFMEEVAKVGGESLKFQKMLKILTPFIYELGYNDDDRLIDEVRERIFNHLMRQSDVGIDYQEQLAFGGQEITDEEVEENSDADETNEEVTDEVENHMEMDMEDGPLDPRAGAVDVILPQLDIDYDKLYQKLIEFGGQKDIKLKNRRILYNLASQFKEITEGSYPLALPEDDTKKLPIPRKEINNAAKRLLELETADSTGKRRKTKKERKRDAKRKLNASQQSVESVGSEDDSQYIHDEELLDHANDNYMSYLEKEVGASADEIDGEEKGNTDLEQAEKSKKGKKKATKERKETGRKRKWTTVVEVEAEEKSGNSETTPSNNDNVIENSGESEEVILIKRPKLNKRSSLSNTPLKGKASRVSELVKTPSNNSGLLNNSLNNSASKRVSFILARNLEHDHADYPVSIARSPSIPFDKDRRPSFGLLKSPATPKSDKLSTPRRRASAIDFFG